MKEWSYCIFINLLTYCGIQWNANKLRELSFTHKDK